MVHGGEGSMVHDGGRERGGPLNFSDDGGRESECSTLSVVRFSLISDDGGRESERERARRAALCSLREECSTIVVRLYRHHTSLSLSHRNEKSPNNHILPSKNAQ